MSHQLKIKDFQLKIIPSIENSIMNFQVDNTKATQYYALKVVKHQNLSQH